MASNRQTSRFSKTSSVFLSPAEMKLFVVFLYYLFSGAFQLTAFSIATRHIDIDINRMITYFNCQRSGENSSCSLPVGRSPYWSLFALIFLLLLPAITLFFAININKFKLIIVQLVKACVSRGALQRKSTGMSSLSSSQIADFKVGN